MENSQEKTSSQQQSIPAAEAIERRDLVQKLGKFALYAAPFTVLAHTNRAEAASSGGPRKTPFPHP